MDSFLNSIPELAPQHLENFVANQMNAYGGNLDMASADIRSYTEQGRAVAVVCGSTLRCKNMFDALTDSGLKVQLSDLLPKRLRQHHGGARSPPALNIRISVWWS